MHLLVYVCTASRSDLSLSGSTSLHMEQHSQHGNAQILKRILCLFNRPAADVCSRQHIHLHNSRPSVKLWSVCGPTAVHMLLAVSALATDVAGSAPTNGPHAGHEVMQGKRQLLGEVRHSHLLQRCSCTAAKSSPS